MGKPTIEEAYMHKIQVVLIHLIGHPCNLYWYPIPKKLRNFEKGVYIYTLAPISQNF